MRRHSRRSEAVTATDAPPPGPDRRPGSDRRPGADPAPFIPEGEENPLEPESFRLFGSKAFLRLWIAQVFSSLGDWVGLFAILGITAQLSNNSAAALSLSWAPGCRPAFFPPPPGGAWSAGFAGARTLGPAVSGA